MGGRGASSGISADGKPYGSEYTTILQEKNIKFVVVNSGSNTSPLETMTKGRIYVTVDKTKGSLKSISFYDAQNMRYKQIDLDHFHKVDGKSLKPHTQEGYFHNGRAYAPTKTEKNLIDFVYRVWYKNHSKL